MNELSLFTGGGGGVLGSHLLGFRPIGYVEWNDYCQQIIAARIRDGFIPRAPIFGDIREFVESGAASEYQGFADVVTAGFPCQPHSIAGKQLGAEDLRDMWPATRDVIRLVRPRYVLLENVPGLAFSGYAGRVCAELASLGFVGRNGCISAADVGANHLRERLWFVADARCGSMELERIGRIGTRSTRAGEELSEERERFRPQIGDSSSHVSDTNNGEREQCRPFGRMGRQSVAANDSEPSQVGDWWSSEPGLGRVADGVANRLDRLKALGNGQVPAVVVRAWEELKP